MLVRTKYLWLGYFEENNYVAIVETWSYPWILYWEDPLDAEMERTGLTVDG